MLKSTNADLTFVTAIYGVQYLPFLAPHLCSVGRCYPTAIELVLWQDLPKHEVDLLSRAFPHCKFVQIKDPIEGDLNQKIPRRILCWHTACQLYPDNPLCFIDCDTLLVKPVGTFVTPDFDVLFTWKDEPFPLNAGVLLVRNGLTGGTFFEEWAARTERIVTDPVALSRALAVSGAGGQHALREIIGFVNYDGLFTRDVAGREVVFKGAPCRLLNETNCVPITGDTHVIHYKAGWHPILLHGQGFTEHRPEEKCREMYDFWMKTATEANRFVARNVVVYAAHKCEGRFRKVIDTYEKRGILHSEMLAVCAVCDELDIEVIIESGRYRGQSTFILANYFDGKGVRVISIELDRENAIKYLGPEVSPAVIDENMAFVEKRLAPYNHVQLLYGDAKNIVPQLVRELAGKRLAILLDGPKGIEAIDLVRKLLSNSSFAMT
jgi:hypothetical protein